MTASETSVPRYSSAVCFIFINTRAATSGGAMLLPAASTQASPLSALMILYGTLSMSFCTASSWKRRPINRLTAYSVFCGLVTAWRLAGWPTNTSSSSPKATIEGVVRSPSEFSCTFPGRAIQSQDYCGVTCQLITDNQWNSKRPKQLMPDSDSEIFQFFLDLLYMWPDSSFSTPSRVLTAIQRLWC